MSLILRNQKGEKITSQEFDNNLVYLRNKISQVPVPVVVGTGSTLTFDISSSSNWWVTGINQNFTASFVSFTQSDWSAQLNLYLNQGTSARQVTNILINGQTISYVNNSTWGANSVDRLEIKIIRVGGVIKTSTSIKNNQPYNSYSLIIGTQSVCTGTSAELSVNFQSVSYQRVDSISMWVQMPSSGFSSRSYSGVTLISGNPQLSHIATDNVLRISWFSVNPYITTGSFTIGTISFTPSSQGTYNITPLKLDPDPDDDYQEEVTEITDANKGELYIFSLIPGQVICNC